MSDESRIHEILDQYSVGRRARVELLGDAGGFSGSAVWRISAEVGLLCLKRWPAETSDERLPWIHAVLAHVASRGVTFVPVPLRDCGGRTFLRRDGDLWELTPWLPGSASYHREPSEVKLRAAMRALAEFHATAETFPNPGPLLAPSPGLVERRDWLRDLQAGGLRELQSAVRTVEWPEFAVRAREVGDLFPRHAPAVAELLETHATTPAPRLPCIRDVWHDHVLFVDDRMSGLIDFGAMRWESAAGDIARLLGSLVGDDADGWRVGLESYQRIRTLTDSERQLIPCFDRSSVLLSGLNWVRWIALEGRRFANRTAVLERLDDILIRLRRVNSPLALARSLSGADNRR